MSFGTGTGLGIEDHAIYLPAISASYAILALNGAFSRPLPITAQQLNFLKPPKTFLIQDGIRIPGPQEPMFHYPYALYSAGQAAKTDQDAQRKSIVSERDRSRTLILGDSGGFQIQTNNIRFEGEKTTERMLRWMERNADYSMILDFPTAGISSGTIKPHRDRLLAAGHDLEAMCLANGLELDFNVCLLQTKLNNDYFVANQQHQTKFLNVLQGRNESESRTWYEAVRHYPFENWAFAGSNQSHLSTVLRRLLDLRRDWLLEKIKWLHILGVSSLPLASLFTTVQECVRKYGHPDFQISFDSASPFRQAARYHAVTAYTIDKYGWRIHSRNIVKRGISGDTAFLNEFTARPMPIAGTPVEKKKARLHRLRFPVATQIGARIKVDDILARQTGTSSADSDSVHVLMNHNVEAYLQAHRRAQKVYAARNPLDMTSDLLSARNLIEWVFQKPDPYRMIDAGKEVLDRFGAEG